MKIDNEDINKLLIIFLISAFISILTYQILLDHKIDKLQNNITHTKNICCGIRNCEKNVIYDEINNKCIIKNCVTLFNNSECYYTPTATGLKYE